MTYWLAYDNTNNALLGVADTAIDEKDGITVKMYEAEMPDMSRLTWNTATRTFYPKPVRELTKLEYMNRFTDTELAMIYTLAKTNVAIEIWLEKFKAVKDTVNLDDPRTVGGIQSLEAYGLIGVGRAAEILS